MRKTLLISTAVALLACGCESRLHQLKRVQAQRRIQLDVVQSFHPPVVDALALAKEQPFAGTAASGRVSVRYPLGMQPLAEEIARQIDGMYGFVQRRTSVRWAFDITVSLVRVDEIPAASVGDRARLIPDGIGVNLFVPVEDETLDGIIRSNQLYPYSFVHEVTELSLICPEGGRSPVLVDAMINDNLIIGDTRWFREGLANYAGEIVTRDYCHAGHNEITHSRPYAALHDAGHMLAQWNAFSNNYQEDRFATTYYNAALGMILEIVRRRGEPGLQALLDDLGREDLANGSAIARLMKRHVGHGPSELVRATTVPFLGIDPRDLTVARAKNLGILAQGGVIVQKTRLFSPARTAGLQASDVITMCDGRNVHNASELERALVAEGVGQPVELTLWRAGRQQTITLTPIERPQLDLIEERLL